MSSWYLPQLTLAAFLKIASPIDKDSCILQLGSKSQELWSPQQPEQQRPGSSLALGFSQLLEQSCPVPKRKAAM